MRSEWSTVEGALELRQGNLAGQGSYTTGRGRTQPYLISHEGGSGRMIWLGGRPQSFVVEIDQILNGYMWTRDGAQVDVRFRARDGVYYQLRSRNVTHGKNNYSLHRVEQGAVTELASVKHGASDSTEWETIRLTVLTDDAVTTLILEAKFGSTWHTVWAVREPESTHIGHPGEFSIESSEGAAIGRIELEEIED